MNNPTDRAHEVRDHAGDAFRSEFPDTADIVQAQTKTRLKHEKETLRQQDARMRREGRIFWACIILAGLLTFAGQAYHMWRLN